MILAILEGQSHVPAFVEDLDTARRRAQRRGRTRLSRVVQGEVGQLVGLLVDAPDQQVIGPEIPQEDTFLLLEDEGSLGASEAGGKLAGTVVGIGQHLIVEPDHAYGQKQGRQRHRHDHAREADPRRLHGQQLVVGGQPAEDHEHSDENGHRHGEGDDPGQVVGEQLQRDTHHQALAQDLVEHLQNDIDDEYEQNESEAHGEGGQVLCEQVSGEGNQGWSGGSEERMSRLRSVGGTGSDRGCQG